MIGKDRSTGLSKQNLLTLLLTCTQCEQKVYSFLMIILPPNTPQLPGSKRLRSRGRHEDEICAEAEEYGPHPAREVDLAALRGQVECEV